MIRMKIGFQPLWWQNLKMPVKNPYGFRQVTAIARSLTWRRVPGTSHCYWYESQNSLIEMVTVVAEETFTLERVASTSDEGHWWPNSAHVSSVSKLSISGDKPPLEGTSFVEEVDALRSLSPPSAIQGSETIPCLPSRWVTGESSRGLEYWLYNNLQAQSTSRN